MELKTVNDGTNTKGRKNACRREKERGREGENIPSYNRMTPVIHIDHYRHPYRRPGSSIWMTRVNRYEVSIIYPSSIGSFSLKQAFLLPSKFIATFIADSIANASLLLYLCSDITQ